MKKKYKTAILGGGNIGTAIASGMIRSGKTGPDEIILTRRNTDLLEDFRKMGVGVSQDNEQAVRMSDVIILAVRPGQMEGLLREISSLLQPENIVVSVVTAYSISRIKKILGKDVPVFRAMPNTAAAVCESVTGLASEEGDVQYLEKVEEIFNQAGRTYILDEELMESAVVLDACGIAYFLRVIRAVMQGGIQIGFHAADAQMIAAQVAKGAASLLLESGNHPEKEIDKVTTPRGVTIAGLNEMEHNGMSSALIKGITASFREIEKLTNEKTVG